MRVRQYTAGRTFMTLAKACFAGDWNFFSCPNLRVQKRRVRPFWRGSGRKFNRVESRTSRQPSYDINHPRIYSPVCPFSVCHQWLFAEKFRQFLFPFIFFILCWTLSLSFYFVTPSRSFKAKKIWTSCRRRSAAFWNNYYTMITLLVNYETIIYMPPH